MYRFIDDVLYIFDICAFLRSLYTPQQDQKVYSSILSLIQLVTICLIRKRRSVRHRRRGLIGYKSVAQEWGPDSILLHVFIVPPHFRLVCWWSLYIIWRPQTEHNGPHQTLILWWGGQFPFIAPVLLSIKQTITISPISVQQSQHTLQR